MTQFFPSAKDPEADADLAINFADDLEVGETIQSAVWLVELEDETAVDPATVLVGSVDLSEHPLVRQRVKGGVNKKSYLHRAKCITSTGRTLCSGGILVIQKGA